MFICMSSQVNLHTLNCPELFMTEIALKSWLSRCGFAAPYFGDLGETLILFHIELFTHKDFYQLIVKIRIKTRHGGDAKNSPGTHSVLKHKLFRYTKIILRIHLTYSKISRFFAKNF